MVSTEPARSRLGRGLRIVLLGALLGLSNTPALVGQARASGCSPETRSGLPQWFQDWFESSGRQARYETACYLNPFYLRGSFDGRGQLDLAVLVVEKSSGKRGILVVHRPGLASYVLGAGTEIGNGGDDFGWLDIWHVDAAPRSETGRPDAGFVGEAANESRVSRGAPVPRFCHRR